MISEKILYELTIFVKHFIVDGWKGCEYTKFLNMSGYHKVMNVFQS